MPNDRDQENASVLKRFASIDDMIDAVLDAEVTGELDERARAVLIARIEADPAKAQELRSLRGAVSMLREPVEGVDFGASVARQVQFASVVDPLYGTRSSGGWVLPAAIAAGTILAASAGLLFMKPAPVRLLPERGAPAPVAEAPTPLHESPSRHATPPSRITHRTDRVTALPMGPTDRHQITGNWNTGVEDPGGTGTLDGNAPATAIAQVDPKGTDSASVPGRLVSVRVGPAWSLWWIPSESADQPASGSEPWRIITRLANPTTNATVNKPKSAPPK